MWEVPNLALISWGELARRVNEDGEFRLASRFWDASLRLDVGAESHVLCFHGGELCEVSPCAPHAACDVHISAPSEEWEKLLEPSPRPFYQDLLAAQIHHGFTLSEDPLAFAAYYPALRRLVEILRETRSG
jgi:hypothetical protein